MCIFSDIQTLQRTGVTLRQMGMNRTLLYPGSQVSNQTSLAGLEAFLERRKKYKAANKRLKKTALAVTHY